MSPIRLAIIEADTPMPKTNARSGGYFGVFSELFTAATAPAPLSSALALTRFNAHDDPDTYPSLDDIDGMLITGSKHNAMDGDAWIVKLVEFTRAAMERGIKVVGVCFGHQIVGRALGTPVLRSDKGWEISVMEIELTAEGKKVFQQDKMNIFQMHRDYVAETPKDAMLLAKTDLCPNQGFYIPGKCITVQGHPEFTSVIVSEIVGVRHELGAFDKSMYEDAMARVDKPHDGVSIAKAFIRFLKGE
ncbi:hypothetical protein TD95_004141 [Thielaviopsis punctulata]|uniref:Glutamine amidotransferase domain-containing protein n=1 Tax=Thielaviopsis punctulata TaxID=72032 RepID=A0A0F4ZEH1_9PEZI|nr:hypothetical protein TD95_004141 [Thielaviopsis punctulata]